MRKVILDLCGGTGSWSKPYADNGYDVRLITLPEYDVMTYIPPDNVYGILAAPPCTEFSIAKWYKLKKEPEKAFVIVQRCLDIIKQCNPKFWALENPRGHLRKYLGSPKLTFQPWEFGDPWTKATDIWGEFNIPKKHYFTWNSVPKLNIYTRPNRKPSITFLHKSEQKKIPQLMEFKVSSDAEFRAITPPGFAQAFFKENI